MSEEGKRKNKMDRQDQMSPSNSNRCLWGGREPPREGEGEGREPRSKGWVRQSAEICPDVERKMMMLLMMLMNWDALLYSI